MGALQRLRDGARLFFHLGNDKTSLLGVALTTASALTLLWFWLLEITSPHPVHPYVGIALFLILPALFVLGLLLIPVGIFWRRRSLARSGQAPAEYPRVDLHSSAVRNVVLTVGALTILNVALLGTATYKGVEYMDSNQFCGLGMLPLPRRVAKGGGRPDDHPGLQRLPHDTRAGRDESQGSRRPGVGARPRAGIAMIHLIHSNHPRRTSSFGSMKQGLEAVPISSAPAVFLTRSEVANLLGVSPNTITRWAREGRLPSQLTLGGHHRFERERVLKLRQSLCRAGIGRG